jgi:hypothetical protein
VVDARCIRRVNDHHYATSNDVIDKYYNFHNGVLVNFVKYFNLDNSGFVN